MLTEAELLDEEWATHWQATWRAHMAAEEPSLRDVALHLSSLQVGGREGGAWQGLLGAQAAGGGWAGRGQWLLPSPLLRADVRACLLARLPLQEHLKYEEHTVHREGFMRLASEARCGLMFPQAGDNLVMLRTGVQQVGGAGGLARLAVH
jgi:hypothetical protein